MYLTWTFHPSCVSPLSTEGLLTLTSTKRGRSVSAHWIYTCLPSTSIPYDNTISSQKVHSEMICPSSFPHAHISRFLYSERVPAPPLRPAEQEEWTPYREFREQTAKTASSYQAHIKCTFVIAPSGSMQKTGATQSRLEVTRNCLFSLQPTNKAGVSPLDLICYQFVYHICRGPTNHVVRSSC